MTLLKPAVVYFAVVFGAGFVFGTVRVLLLVPRFGVRVAELLEMPLMLVSIFLAARWLTQRYLAGRDQATRLLVGFVALILVLMAEISLAVTLRSLSPREAIINRDPIAGTAYYLALCVFALMPWFLERVRRR